LADPAAQDKLIVEHNQPGINFCFYEPGPYAPMEADAIRLCAWYLNEVCWLASRPLPGKRGLPILWSLHQLAFDVYGEIRHAAHAHRA
jgi:hypothetical protein